MSTDHIPATKARVQVRPEPAHFVDTPPGQTAGDQPVESPEATTSTEVVPQAAGRTNGTARRSVVKRSIAAFIAIGIITSFSIYLLRDSFARDDGPNLTHTISRGDLVVTVTEQGTLESSDNTEIKCRVRGWSTVTWIIEGGTVVEPGDVLVELDTKRIDDAISLHTTDSHTARATLERTRADVKAAEIAEAAYLEGRYKSQRKSLERSLKIAESNLETAKTMLDHSKSMFNRGYISALEVEGNEFTVTQAQLELEVIQTQLYVLDKYTKEMELEIINGRVLSSNSKLQADLSGLKMDEGRRDRAIKEREFCVIKAEKNGMVIYPSAAAWKDTPDVTEGASVRKDQILLLMPDLNKMQVKVGIHESIIDRIKPGQAARITMSDGALDGSVKTVASVARPAGWWTGNVVKYDTIIAIPQGTGLKPGMSAEVQVVLAEHRDVLTVPVAAVVETERENLCWVKTQDGVDRRSIVLGDSNEVFIVVESGLREGEEVILNPRAHIEEAKSEILKTINEASADEFASSAIDSRENEVPAE